MSLGGIGPGQPHDAASLAREFAQPFETPECADWDRARTLPEPWRRHFPKSISEVENFRPWIIERPLAEKVLAVLTTRPSGTFEVRVDAVPGLNYKGEALTVSLDGCKVREAVARALFPAVPAEVPYAD